MPHPPASTCLCLPYPQSCLLQLLRLRSVFAEHLAPGGVAQDTGGSGGRAAASGATAAEQHQPLSWERVGVSAKVLTHISQDLQARVRLRACCYAMLAA